MGETGPPYQLIGMNNFTNLWKACEYQSSFLAIVHGLCEGYGLRD